MKTTLNAAGQIDIPRQIRETDRLVPGDSFELERLTSGHYLLAKQSAASGQAMIAAGEDGLPLIRVRNGNGVITSRLVREIESQTP